jgi:hypothetical protein
MWALLAPSALASATATLATAAVSATPSVPATATPSIWGARGEASVATFRDRFLKAFFFWQAELGQ